MDAYRYYIGLDAHKKNCYFAVMNFSGKVVKRRMVPTVEAEMIQFLESINGSKALVFEETGLSQWLYILLSDKVDFITVCQAPEKTAKTDFRDAIELADLLRVNRLKTVYHGANRYMELRDLVHGYDTLVQEIVRQKNRLKGLFNRSAINTSKLKLYTDKQVIGRLPTKTQRFVAGPLFDQIQLLEQQKTEYLKVFKNNINRFKEMRLITGIPGFGEVLANRVVAYVITPKRFPTKYKFFAYAMLIRHKQMSDGVQYGNKRVIAKLELKGVFKTAINVALLRDNAFSRKYNELISRGVEPRCARNSVARSLASTVLGVWKTGKRYQDSYWEVKRRGHRLAEKIRISGPTTD